MKGGFESVTSLTRKVILLVVVIAVLLIIAYYGDFFGKASAEPLEIATLCPQWVSKDCSWSDAAKITKEVNGDTKTLRQMCEEKYSGIGNPETECKKECLGCP